MSKPAINIYKPCMDISCHFPKVKTRSGMSESNVKSKFNK